MGKFSTMAVGVSGLTAAQTGLYVTGHNMANVDTIGFTRQQALQHDFKSVNISYSGRGVNQVGLGTDVTCIRQIRNKFLDMSYRAEAGKYNFYNVKATTGREIEAILGELQSQYSTDTVFKDLFNSLQELSFDASSLAARGNFISTAITFIDKAENVSKRLLEYQYNLDLQIRETVQKINQLVNSIEKYNKLIMDAEMAGDRANDYRDSRNVCLDELSHLLSIDYKEDPINGRINITTEGKELLVNGVAKQIGLRYVGPDNNLVEPVFTTSNQILAWDENAVAVIDYSRPISAIYKNDSGHLKGLMVSRGMYLTTYASEPVPYNYAPKPAGAWMSYSDASAGLLPGAQDWLNYYNAQLALKNNFNLNCMIPKFMQQFDTIVNSVVTMINNAVSPTLTIYEGVVPGSFHYLNNNGEWTDANGIPLTTPPADTDFALDANGNRIVANVVRNPNAPYNLYYNNDIYNELTNDEGIVEIFVRKNMDRFNAAGDYNTEQAPYLADGTKNPNYNYFSLYTAGNLMINPALLTSGGYNLIALMTLESNDPDAAVQGISDNHIVLDNLLKNWKSEIVQMGSETLSIDDAYRRFVTNLGIETSEAINYVNEQGNLLVLVDNKRQAISAVSLDEEMRNMMIYQHAYNAAARVINVVDSMIDKVVNGTGRVGR